MTDPPPLEAKLDRYRRFWGRTPTDRPLIGFSIGGWFPFQHYRAMHPLRDRGRLAPDDLRPEAFLADYDDLPSLRAAVEDDMIRGVSPLPFFPWLEAMLGCRVQIGTESVWAEEGGVSYADCGRIDCSDTNPWRVKYLEFVRVLHDHFGDRVPVGIPILRGPSDMVAALRGSEQMVYDLYDLPEAFHALAATCADFAVGLMHAQHDATGPYAGGYLIEQLGLWAPERIARLQEDASALFSPDLYDRLLKPYDRRMGEAFPVSAIHLHSSSLHLLDRILDVEALRCIQINKDVGNITIAEMLESFRMVQARGRCLLIRGKLALEELALLRRHLVPEGLYLQCVAETADEARSLRGFLAPWR
jgi:hypothetical protein